MGQTLTEIAQTLRDANKKVQLIYAFNGTGKTRLSREFKALIAPTDANAAEGEQEQNESIGRILYYNAFTEDLAERETNRFNDLEYVFIDDPVSSLDDNHLIELAVNIAELIKSSPSNLHYIITTHNPLFINVLINEIGNKICYMLDKQDDGTYELKEKKGDSNKSFSYHLYLKHIIEEAITTNSIQKYHFILLRNLYEKTANFLGYPQWSELLPDDKKVYYNRIIQFTSHSTLSNEVVPEPTEPEKQVVKFLLDHLVNNNYYKEEQNGTV